MAKSPNHVRNRVLLGVAILLILLVAWASWVAVRGLMARDALQSAATEIRTTQATASLDALGDLGETVDSVGEKSARAASLTSDPAWRAAEVIPGIGPNLVAFRQTATGIDDIVRDALPSLVAVADALDADSLTLRDGGLPIDELRTAQPDISQAQRVVAAANERLDAVQTDGVIDQIGQAVAQVRGLARDADQLLTGLDTAARLLPPMLGGDGARDYLLLFQNNAELRASGGIPGATAIVTAEGGDIALGAQANSSDFRAPGGQPVVELTGQEEALFGDQLGRFVQNVSQTPDFTRTGQISQAWWQQVGGVQVDGVVSLDPVVLSYLLQATGPVTLADGSEINAENAVARLLNETYLDIEDPRVQDAFFAEAAASVFSQVSSFDGDAGAMLDALARGVEERRILIWSADEAEQQLLAETPLAGLMPQSDEDRSGFGIYLNDATAAKMSYYLDGVFRASSTVCRNDGRPEFSVGATLTSNAPADAASLPDYITGAGVAGVPLGNVRTLVQMVVPPDALVTSALVDGEETEPSTNLLGDQMVATFETELAPGQSVDVAIRVLGDLGASETVELEYTPMARSAGAAVDSSGSCRSAAGSAS